MCQLATFGTVECTVTVGGGRLDTFLGFPDLDSGTTAGAVVKMIGLHLRLHLEVQFLRKSFPAGRIQSPENAELDVVPDCHQHTGRFVGTGPADSSRRPGFDVVTRLGKEQLRVDCRAWR